MTIPYYQYRVDPGISTRVQHSRSDIAVWETMADAVDALSAAVIVSALKGKPERQ